MANSNRFNEYIGNGIKKLSLNKCKEVFNKNGLTYTDEEILLMRDFLYRLAEISITHWNCVQERKTQTDTLPDVQTDYLKTDEAKN